VQEYTIPKDVGKWLETMVQDRKITQKQIQLCWKRRVGVPKNIRFPEKTIETWEIKLIEHQEYTISWRESLGQIQKIPRGPKMAKNIQINNHGQEGLLAS